MTMVITHYAPEETKNFNLDDIVKISDNVPGNWGGSVGTVVKTPDGRRKKYLVEVPGVGRVNVYADILEETDESALPDEDEVIFGIGDLVAVDNQEGIYCITAINKYLSVVRIDDGRNHERYRVSESLVELMDVDFG